MLLQQLTRHRQLFPLGSTVVVGVSGGVDSLTLLHALHQFQDEWGFQLVAATLDHGLRGTEGAADTDFVYAIAEAWGIPCVRGNVDVPTIMQEYGLNLEDAARQARFTFLFDTAIQVNADQIALAHHQNDQAETLLMHIIRGTGLRGLRGMQYASPLSEEHLLEDWEDFINADAEPADFTIIRPLLGISRQTIEAYANEHHLTPRHDDTNSDTTRLRNLIRHELLPQIQKVNPNIYASLSRLASLVQGDLEVVDNRVENIASWMLDWSGTEPLEPGGEPGEVVFLDRAAFTEQPIGIQRGLIRKIISELSTTVAEVTFDLVERARLMILEGQTSTQMVLPDDVVLRVGYDEVTIGYGGNPVYPHTLPSLKPDQQVRIDPEGPPFQTGHLRLMTYWVTEGRSKDYRPSTPLECTLTIPENAVIMLRTMQTGDRFRPFGMNGKSQKLSDTFTNLKVPAFYRHQVPLLIINDEIAWFVAPTANGPQGRIGNAFAVQDDNQSILRLRWQNF